MQLTATTRRATQADFSFAWQQYESAVRPLMEPHILRVRGEKWESKVEQTRFAALWDPAKVLIIECDSNSIGWLAVDDASAGVTLENFYIDERFRGKGLGRSLLTWLASQYPGRQIRVSVIPGVKSSAFYLQAGPFQLVDAF
jgi:GNAT superfamily N-acetyltransferase